MLKRTERRQYRMGGMLPSPSPPPHSHSPVSLSDVNIWSRFFAAKRMQFAESRAWFEAFWQECYSRKKKNVTELRGWFNEWCEANWEECYGGKHTILQLLSSSPTQHWKYDSYPIHKKNNLRSKTFSGHHCEINGLARSKEPNKKGLPLVWIFWSSQRNDMVRYLISATNLSLLLLRDVFCNYSTSKVLQQAKWPQHMELPLFVPKGIYLQMGRLWELWRNAFTRAMSMRFCKRARISKSYENSSQVSVAGPQSRPA